MERRHRLAALGICLLALAPAPARPACEDAVPPIEDGFGAPGVYPVRTATVENPAWGERPVHVFLPETGDGAGPGDAVPVVFFAHGFGAVDPVHYRSLMEHLAGRGLATVYVPYPVTATSHERRYQTLWAGFEAAAREQGERLDLSRVGFVGHSFGGGATPAMAWRGLVEHEWGKRGAFLATLAPWYVLGVEQEQLAGLPDHLRVLVQVYEDERINDHRIAIDLYHALGVPEERKSFVLVRSDRQGTCSLRAIHTTPVTDGIRGRIDGLDRWGVFRQLDALAADAFSGSAAAGSVLPGEGEVDMGRWRDGTPVATALATRRPEPARPEYRYRFPLSAREIWIHSGDLAF